MQLFNNDDPHPGFYWTEQEMNKWIERHPNEAWNPQEFIQQGSSTAVNKYTKEAINGKLNRAY